MPKKFAKKSKQNKVKRIDSDQPTVAIAPSDYAHIFQRKGAKGTPKSSKGQKKAVKRIDSDGAASAIPPSAYQHILERSSGKAPKVHRITSDTPTQAIAPSDYVHIYDQTGKRGLVKSPKPEVSQSQRNITQKGQQKQPRSANDVPQGLVDQIENFLATLPKKYDID